MCEREGEGGMSERERVEREGEYIYVPLIKYM